MWNLVKQETDARLDLSPVKEGEIKWCRLGKNIGNESYGKGETFRRPVLILKKFSTDVFLGIPLTTKIHHGSWYVTLTHTTVERCAILNQARILDRKRLEEKIYEVSENELRSVKEAYCKLILS